MPIPTKNLLARNVFENECIKMRKAFCRNSILCFKTKKKTVPLSKGGNSLVVFMSLLSDSNQRPRDYKSRALAN